MAGSTRTFEYAIQADPELIPRLMQRAEARACESNDQVTCHGVTGDALGLVILNLTVTGRDQWACRQIVQDILNYVTWGLSVKVTKLDLRSHRQEPHDHRGYSHGRTKRTRDPGGSRPRPSRRQPGQEPPQR